MASELISNDIDGTVGTFIPATQRPDGSWRKARRVKDGYVPQEEVPLYESKGKQWAKTSSTSSYPPGLQPHLAAKSQFPVKIISGLTLTEIEVTKSNKKKKKKKLEKLTDCFEDLKVSESQQVHQLLDGFSGQNVESKAPEEAKPDPAKRLKNLKKKLREIEALEKRIGDSELKNPEEEQLEKIARKREVESQIDKLEAEIEKSVSL